MARQRTEIAAAADGWDRRRLVLLSEYERVALELFAARGYHQVTVDDIAAAVGVTTRTLFRYFPSKQDCLLGLPRRGLIEEIEMIATLPVSQDPLGAGFAGICEFVSASPLSPSVVELWDAATVGAPEVVARVRGERIDGIFQAFVTYGERCLAVNPDQDPRPRMLAGVLAGIELTLVESVAQVPGVYDAVLGLASQTVRKMRSTFVPEPVARRAVDG